MLSSRSAAAAGILAFLLAAPVSGFGYRAGSPTTHQSQAQAAGGRGAAAIGAAPPKTPGQPQSGGGCGVASASPSKTPGQTASPQASPRPTPNAEQALAWDWWNDETCKKELKLTDMQVRQITQIFDRRVREFTPTYEEFVKQRAELDRMTRERTVDEATYALQVGRTQYLQSELSKTRAVMLYAIYRRLDPKQYEQLRVIRDRRVGRGGGAPAPRS